MKKAVIISLSLAALILLTACGRKNEQEETPGLSLFNTVCSADEALAAAKVGDAVAFEGLRLSSGQEVWEDFYAKVQEGEPASVVCAYYYTLDRDRVSEELWLEEKDKYPVLFFYLTEYDGESFTLTVRQSDKTEPERWESFKYLIHNTEDANKGALFSYADVYFLADNPELTWAEIQRRLLSSQLIEDGVDGRSSVVYHRLVD